MQHKKQKDKRKRFCAKISQNPFVYCFLLTHLPCFAKGAGVWGLRRPQRFFGSFLTPKKNIILCLEWKIEKHKWSFPARLAVTSSWSFWSSAIHVALVKARWKTWRRLRWHVAPRVAAVCAPVVPAATNARIARTNEATAFVVAIIHIIIN